MSTALIFCIYPPLTLSRDAMSDSKHRFLHELFRKHAHEVSTFISGRWPKEPDVADIVQETFLRLAQYPNPDEILNQRAFLFQAASNIAVDRHRRTKIRERYAEPDEDIEAIATLSSSPDRYWENREALDRFSEWLGELPVLQRHAFVLYRIEGCVHAEIAARLGISASTSERYVRLAMQHLSKRLSGLQL